jgi:hypothetical protein
MYGTIAKFRIKPGMEARMFELMERDYAEKVPGSIDDWVYRSDEDPRTFYMAVLFQDKESYVRNANSPERNERYRHWRDLLESDPEWHDGEVVYVDSQHRGSTQGRAAA